MPLYIRVTVEGDGFGKEETIRRVYRALEATGIPLEPASKSGPRPHLRPVPNQPRSLTASGDQQ